jgi:hypothetical protein
LEIAYCSEEDFIVSFTADTPDVSSRQMAKFADEIVAFH